METSASSEARSAPSLYPTAAITAGVSFEGYILMARRSCAVQKSIIVTAQLPGLPPATW